MGEKDNIPGIIIEKSPKNSGLGKASHAFPSLISPGKCSKIVMDPGFRIRYFVFPGLWGVQVRQPIPYMAHCSVFMGCMPLFYSLPYPCAME